MKHVADLISFPLKLVENIQGNATTIVGENDQHIANDSILINVRDDPNDSAALLFDFNDDGGQDTTVVND